MERKASKTSIEVTTRISTAIAPSFSTARQHAALRPRPRQYTADRTDFPVDGIVKKLRHNHRRHTSTEFEKAAPI
jgi:hypothetical protein